jgi:tricorn protease
VREDNAFKVDRIYRGGSADGVRSPLDEPGVNLDEGDYILAVNHQPFRSDEPFEASLENVAGKEVMLTVNDRPSTDGARQVVVKPMRDEHGLIYADWVRRNREYVAEKTDGRIGYVHIPDMSGRGLVAFNRWFYPQLEREGMVVDVRWNGGGFVSQLILARLQRHIISWDRTRYGTVWSYPYRTLNGPFVVLTNENAGSDGDIFPAAVQLAGLAPVIGKRSWGGVVGMGTQPLVDGGGMAQPVSAWWDHERGWDLEGRGVEPDIEVTNLPQDLAKGIDAQLHRGIEEVMRLRNQKPPVKPEFGPAPDRSRAAYRHEL